MPAPRRLASLHSTPLQPCQRSLTTKGTPANTAPASKDAAATGGSTRPTIAFSASLTASMAPNAARASSSRDASPARTSAARPSPSWRVYSDRFMSGASWLQRWRRIVPCRARLPLASGALRRMDDIVIP